MSETGTSSCCNGGACSHKASSSTGTQTTGIQNGKGDAPRNISSKFRNNYDQINWGSSRKRK